MPSSFSIVWTLRLLLLQVRSKPKSLIAVVTEGCEPVQCYSIGERLKTVSVDVPRLPQAAVKVMGMLMRCNLTKRRKSITHSLNFELSARWRFEPLNGSLYIKQLKSGLWEFVLTSAGQLNQILLVFFLKYLFIIQASTLFFIFEYYKGKWNDISGMFFKTNFGELLILSSISGRCWF